MRVIAALVGAGGACPALAGAAPEGSAVPRPPDPFVWSPPAAGETGDDWIRLTSGEWLRGDLQRLRNDELEFDSEDLDDVDLDFEDVDYFRFPRSYTYRFRNREFFRGRALLQDGLVRIRTRGGEIVERRRDRLVIVTRGGGNELDRWSVDVGLGFTGRQGNTDQTDLTGRADIERETAFNRWLLRYNGAFTSLEGDTTANNHRALTALDFFLTWRFFVRAPFLEFFTDEFQNINARYTSGLGLGYEIVDTARVDWDAIAGVAYQRTQFESGGPGANDVAAIFGTSLELEVTSDLDFDNSYALQLVATDLGKTNHHLESVLSFDVWGPLDLDVNFVWDRIESPETESGGDTPKSDDFRMTVGLSIDF